ncbi:putative monooxygenase [Mytilinidion resinicola]|uniref:Monooxygenase n=1 Tax=Mytilinidion resinicola TaxID=574789 RepID=A0A6A6YPW8_9PEZI|nr:putative monooxygenase [Mytilinidion resinicola]KAF2810599.1 putative monooxygenase [Mytilinidion resinicola]
MTTDTAPLAAGEPDVKVLARKYAEERDKRYAARAEHQYLSLREIRDAEFAQDPFVDYEHARANETEIHDGEFRQCVIIGAGHNGLLFAVRLIEAGISVDNILLIDNASGYGGVWYWNRYPGLMCDVESYIYLPLLEETGFVPKHRYSYGEEIRTNTESIAKKYNLKALFTTTATRMDWDDDRVEWTTQVTRDLGQEGKVDIKIRSQFLFIAAGPLTVPKMPDVPGMDEYLEAGKHIFHSARWDFELTGGTQQNPEMTKLRDKKVAIVGTGATGVQVIPEVAKYAEKLYVCQRTPSYVGTRGQKETDPDDWKRVARGKGWQAARADNFNLLISNDPEPENLVGDGWTETGANAAFQGGKGKYPIVTPEVVADHVAYFMEMDVEQANNKRALIDKVVANKTVAEQLKPWYAGWCKRPIFNDDYLPTFTRPNVQLVDLDGKSIEKFTSKGIVANGIEYDVDIIVLATGFELLPNASASTRANAPIRGRNGRLLDDKWNSYEYDTLHGCMSHDFPNLFFQGVFGQATSSNLTRLYSFQAEHCAFVVQKALSSAPKGEMAIVETPIAAEEEWGQETSKRALFFSTLPLCTPGYFTGDAQVRTPGTPEEIAFMAKRIPWPGGVTDYGRILGRWRDAGEWKTVVSAKSVAQTNGVDKLTSAVLAENL